MFNRSISTSEHALSFLISMVNEHVFNITRGVHCLSTVNNHERAQKGYYLEQACTKCTYKRHIVIKQEVDVHEAGDKAIENICQVWVYAFMRSSQTWTKNQAFSHPLSNDLICM